MNKKVMSDECVYSFYFLGRYFLVVAMMFKKHIWGYIFFLLSLDSTSNQKNTHIFFLIGGTAIS